MATCICAVCAFAACSAVAVALGFPWAAASATTSATADPPVQRCPPIHYVFNPDHAPVGGLEMVQSALVDLHAASGLTFVYDGVTAEAPSADRPAAVATRGGLRALPVLIAWIEPGTFSGGWDAATAGLTQVWWAHAAPWNQFVSGWIYLDASRSLRTGFETRQSWGGLLLHELGHLAGLGHSTDPAQLMYPVLLPGPARWGITDRLELNLAGQHAGCPAPPPSGAP